MTSIQKIGVAGVGALGSIVVDALASGAVRGYDLVGLAEPNEVPYDIPKMSFEELADSCDVVVECLPPRIVPDLARPVLGKGKTLIAISSSALLMFPEIKNWALSGQGRILVPSGALAGLDAVSALKWGGIDSVIIASTKPPRGFAGAPFIVEHNIDVSTITERVRLFSGNALEAAKAFPANVNVAATLSLAGLGPEKTQVEVWADPDAVGNSHDITVKGGSSTITTKVQNSPDPRNPKSSMLAGYSIVATLKKQTEAIIVV